MKFLIFVLTYPFIWLLSKLPMSILYLISDFLYILIYYVFGYRKQVVLDNLKLAFSEKNIVEIERISKKFFHHFTDLIMESVKTFSISEKEIKNRYVFKNSSIINKLAKEGKSIALMGAHQANWEWVVSISLSVDIECCAIYTKIQNPYFEKVIKSYRTKFGAIACTTSEFKRSVKKRVQNNIQSLYILLSDQSPQLHKTKYWANFFNVQVPTHTGAEVLSKQYNFAAVNVTVTKIKRGYYESCFQLITDVPKTFKNYEITDAYLKITEEHIKKQPEFYLWSHKRFKHVGK